MSSIPHLPTLSILLTLLILFSTHLSLIFSLNIAFVFAGSARSFILPFVHQSISSNFIQSLCPSLSSSSSSSSSSSQSSPFKSTVRNQRHISDNCSYHIFFRITILDNIIHGFDAKGRIIQYSTEKMKRYINQALLSFPEDHVSSQIINSDEENYSGSEQFTNNIKHKIFRTFDNRRYNMYFNRWAAHQMMLAYEKLIGYQYDYVVHTRLDVAWFAPVPSFQNWYYTDEERQRVIIHDRWAEFVSDTFAILPRPLSDDYYSMDVLFQPGIMCLGGPNFNHNSINLTHIIKAGFTAEDEPLISNELCENAIQRGKCLFRKDGSRHDFLSPILLDHWKTSLGTKVYFTGYSEQILGRKFEYMGINLQQNTWIYRPLPMSIIRYERNRGLTAHSQCVYLNYRHLYGHTKTILYHSNALEIGCIFGNIYLHRRADICEQKTRELVPSYRQKYPDSQERLLDFKQDCETSLGNETRSRTVNFIPFLIKSIPNKAVGVEKCVTVDEESLEISLQPCIRKYTSPKNLKLIYSTSQLFSFKPTLPHTQKIQFYSTKTLRHYCLSFISILNETVTPKVAPCHTETATSLKSDRESLANQKEATVIQTIRTKIKLPDSYSDQLKQQRPPLVEEDSDNGVWFKTDEIFMKIMITKSIEDSDFKLIGSSSLHNYRRQKRFHSQLCLQPKLSSRHDDIGSTNASSSLIWASCSFNEKENEDAVQYRRNENVIFIAERAMGIWGSVVKSMT